MKSYIPNRLYELLNDKKLVPFLGAGFSIPSGTPSWSNFVKELANATLNTENIQLLNQLDGAIDQAVLTEIIENMGQTEYAMNEFFSEKLSNHQLVPNAYHDYLNKLNFNIVLTTNWDQLIEKSFDNNSIPIRIIYKDNQVPFYNPNKEVQILKIHGTINDIDSLVYRKSHYHKFWEDKQLLFNLLTTIMATNSILFMGYGLGDPNIITLLEKIKNSVGELRREHYALTYDNDAMKGVWNRFGITEIKIPKNDNYSNYYEDGTIDFLRTFSINSDSSPLTNLDRAKLVNKELEKIDLKSPPMPHLRMRGSLGWLSNPIPIEGEPIYGSMEQDNVERKMTEIIEKILLKSSKSKVKCILHLKASPLLERYKPHSIVRRMEMILEMMKKFPTQIEIVNDKNPSYSNEMIFDLFASLVGFKPNNSLGIKKISITRDRNFIRNEINNFESDFHEIHEKNRVLARKRGINTNIVGWENKLIEEIIKNEIDSLNNSFSIKQNHQKLIFTDEAELFSKALLFATKKHFEFNQLREDNVTPYIIHIYRVIERLRAAGYKTDYVALSAAALHDLVEDCEVSIKLIEELFGEKISIIVDDLTQKDNQSINDYVNQLEKSSDISKSIKLADKWDNICDLIKFNNPTFGNIPVEKYIADSVLTLQSCKDGNQLLYTTLKEEILKAKNNYKLI